MKEDSTVQTTADNEEQLKQNKKQSGNFGRNILTFIRKHLKVVLMIAGIIFSILFLIGIISLFLTMPGLILGKLKQFSNNLISKASGWFTGDDISAKISKEDEVGILQYLQDMGYDVEGYGFGNVEYEQSDDTTKNIGLENGKIVNLRTNGRKDYLKAYMVQNEAIYTLSAWSISGFFKSLFASGTTEDYSKGMINVTINSKEANASDSDLYNAIKKTVAIDKDKKLLRIQMGKGGILSSSYYYFNMANWSSRYGKPLELFLALHLSTMMPDLTYDLATAQCFNTKVNIDMQEVNTVYTVSYTKDNVTIEQTEIEKIYLYSKWELPSGYLDSMTDEEIEEFYKYVNENKEDGKIDLTYIKMLMDGDKNPKKAEDDYTEYDVEVDSHGNIVSSSQTSNSSSRSVSEMHSSSRRLSDDLDNRFTTPSSNNSVSSSNSGRNNTTNTSSSSSSSGSSNSQADDNPTHTEKRKKMNPHTYAKERDESSEQSIIDSSSLSGMSKEQLKEMIKIIDEGKNSQILYWPRITSVTKHWYYNDIEYTYGRAGKATKRIKYQPEDETNALHGVDGIVLNATMSSSSGVYYQLCEPEATGPNSAIVALFKGNDSTYDFTGEYYRYDGSRKTAQDIADGKAQKEPVTFYDSNNKNSYKNAYSAFAILENVDTQEGEQAYRNLKELMVILEYFKEDELKDPMTQVLNWIMPDNLDKNNLKKDIDKFGITINNSSGKSVIAPGNGKVISVSGNTVTIKLEKIDTSKMDELKSKYADQLYSIDENSVLDMQIVITGINPSVAVGQSVSINQNIGTANQNDVQVYMKYSDGSIVDNIETYMKQELPEAKQVDTFEKRGE